MSNENGPSSGDPGSSYPAGSTGPAVGRAPTDTSSWDSAELPPIAPKPDLSTMAAPGPGEAPFPASVPRRATSIHEMSPPSLGTETIVLIDEPGNRPGSKRVFWIVGGVALLALILFLADWTMRNIETMQLLTQIEKSEAAMGTFQTGVASLELPDTGQGTEPETDLAQELVTEIEALAATSAAEVVAAGKDVADVSFLPWHRRLIDAQSVYLTHNQAWVAYLTAGSDEATALFEPNSALQSDIGMTWEAAELAVRAAVPKPPFPGISARVDAIFEDGDDSGSSGLQALAR
jgi:hypothetical protein